VLPSATTVSGTVVPYTVRGVLYKLCDTEKKKKTFSVSLCVAFSLLYMSPDVAFLVKVFFFEVKKIICRQNKKKSVDRIKIFLVRNKNFLVDRFFFLDDDDELRKHYYLSISVAVIFF